MLSSIGIDDGGRGAVINTKGDFVMTKRFVLFALIAVAVMAVAHLVGGVDLASIAKAMVVVTMPLMSGTASGSLGGAITFDKRGFVRQLVIPANPQSDAQGNVRQMLLAVQKGLTKLGETVIGDVKTVAPTAYRWNSFMVKQCIGPNSSEFEASIAAFVALAGTGVADWNTRAAALGLVEQSIEYATDDAISAGGALFAISRTLYALGFNGAAGAPAAGNYDAWGDYFES
jgi:hypothetical protein